MAQQTTTTAGTGAHTKVLPCDCNHPSQDILHGKGLRVHNPCKAGAKHRCTVCGREK